MIGNFGGDENLINRVKHFFIESGYGPGDQVEPEIELAEKFSVPRAKMREVLSALCHEGMLSRKPRRGTVVEPFNAEKAGEHLRFRFQLAGFDPADAREARRVVEMAVLPLVIRRITPKTITRLQETINQMRKISDDPERADKLDRDFHLLLLDACGNETLSAFSGVIEFIFRRELRSKFFTPEMIDRAVREHTALLDAIKNDDEEGALELMSVHLGDR